MSTARGAYRNGQIVLNGPPPPGWRDGAEVVVYAVTDPITGPVPDDWSTRPETVAAWVAAYDAIAAAEPAATDEEKWRIARRSRTGFELASFFEHGDRLSRLFDG
jgi:hypothetical protein